MAPRRARKVVKLPKNHVYTDLKLSSVMCPICRTILIEPVSLPCNHDFCLSCFEGTMANANLVCPLCRIRVGSWLRNAKKEKSLVNSDFWNAIRDKFPDQVNNKLEGVDEMFDEKPIIKIASPGAIRKEYENQKQIEEAEMQRQRDIEVKASEELIRKITEEEEFEKSVVEEKIRLDREIAKQIAKNLCSEAGPSNIKSMKKQGPLDRFLKNAETNKNNRYATKDFAARILCQKNKADTKTLHKSHLQIQRLAAEAEVSDSSDCIESECRYFKPIDHKSIPPSKALSPIKIPTKMGNATTVIIGAPRGTIKFNHSTAKSAFIAVRYSYLADQIKNNESERHSADDALDKLSPAKNKRHNGSTCAESLVKVSKRPSIRSDEVISSTKRKLPSTSPVLHSSPKKRLVPLLRRRTSKLERQNSSPPFYGFDSSERNNYAERLLEHVISKDVMSDNGDGDVISNNNWEDAALKKKLQEQADLEFAKKLQAELNSDGYGRYSTRQGFARNKRNSSRQVTIDEIIKSQCKVGL